MTDKRIKRQFLSLNWTTLLRVVVLTLLAVGTALIVTSHPALAATSSASKGFHLQDMLRRTLVWIDGLGPVGALAYIALYIVATVAFLPGSIITLGGGAIFGVVLGSIYVFIGASLGATVAFLIGRYLARDWVFKQIAGNEKFRKIDEAVGEEGFKIVFLTRLSPVFPFNLLNYAFGVTGVSLKGYLLGFIGMIPGTVMYVYLGSLAGACTQIGIKTQHANSIAEWTMRIIGFIATVGVTLFVTRIARKALEEKVS
ncbi:MAG TPA: TVP38/TMEM64 family protein [Waterburya sp.]|jgi:uncharacterized membrane protein YdjX (TVP38/TMEM64 family)